MQPSWPAAKHAYLGMPSWQTPSWEASTSHATPQATPLTPGSANSNSAKGRKPISQATRISLQVNARTSHTSQPTQIQTPLAAQVILPSQSDIPPQIRGAIPGQRKNASGPRSLKSNDANSAKDALEGETKKSWLQAQRAWSKVKRSLSVILPLQPSTKYGKQTRPERYQSFFILLRSFLSPKRRVMWCLSPSTGKSGLPFIHRSKKKTRKPHAWLGPESNGLHLLFLYIDLDCGGQTVLQSLPRILQFLVIHE
ncbi:hypothetical protein DFH07DRAFT_783895 [Mycena maculata]|uniref:Uncharacterized protein n=1 Tax=Mycena maculata TaxID=230809 RepID=A0AAD7MKV3_9AGAR|nr:hypothetical protein DFH07DRAFT_783895 [Mycena maculata]